MRNAKTMSRRGFLGRGAAAGVLAGFPAIVPASALGRDGHTAPSERIVVGAVGVGEQGMDLLSQVTSCKGAQLVAVCDVNRDHLATAAAFVNGAYGGTGCATHVRHEELTGRDDIDAVLIASCDHWHVLHALAAVRSGKGVYVEKPLGLTVAEDKALRDEVVRRGVAFQFGTMQRSEGEFRRACELVRNGVIGKLHTVYVWCPQGMDHGPAPEVPVPAALDYDRWLGPAPFKPYTEGRERNLCWFFMSDYSLGFIAGWGIHPMDIAFWGAGEMMHTPCWFEGVGRIPAAGLCDTVMEWKVFCTYDSGLVVEYRSLPAPRDWIRRFDAEIGQGMFNHGTAFVGEDGWIQVNRLKITASSPDLLAAAPTEGGVRLHASGSHMEDFIESVRTGRPTVSPIEDALRADCFCHACDLSIRLGKRLRWDPAGETFVDAPDAAARLERPMRAPWTLA